MRIRLDPGCDPDEHAPHARGRGARRLVERVEHDDGAGLGGRAQLLVALVVAVHDEPLAGEAGGAREAELAQRRHVRTEPFVAEHRMTATFGNAFVP